MHPNVVRSAFILGVGMALSTTATGQPTLDQAVAWTRYQEALTADSPFFIYYTPGAVHAQRLQPGQRPRRGASAEARSRSPKALRV